MRKDFSIENLIKVGLTKSEAVIYINLLKRESFTASEVSRISEISRSKTYEILNQLVLKGLCIEILGNVKKYSPANPNTAFNGLLQRYQQDYQQELEYKKIIMSNLSESLLPLYSSEKTQTNPFDYIQVLREKSRIAEKFISLEKRVKEEVLAFTRGPYAVQLEDNEEALTIIKKGIITKSIYEVDDVRKPDFFKCVSMLAAAGEEIRISHKLPIKMVIFDNKTVMLTLENSLSTQHHLTAMIVEHADMAKTLKETFNMHWQKSMTLEEFKIKEKVE